MSIIKVLDWSDKEINIDNVVIFNTIGDGSCFFHAIVGAFYTDYIKGYDETGKYVFDRIRFISDLRSDMAIKLDTSSKIDPKISWYDSLSRGELPKISKDIPYYSLDSMKNRLNSNDFAGHDFVEYTSELLNIDIYIIDGEKKDIYMMGNDKEIFWDNAHSKDNKILD